MYKINKNNSRMCLSRFSNIFGYCFLNHVLLKSSVVAKNWHTKKIIIVCKFAVSWKVEFVVLLFNGNSKNSCKRIDYM